MKWNCSISIVGLGFAVGVLAPVLGLSVSIMVAIGLGLMVGGIFRELNQLNRKITMSDVANKTS
jgi:hypothetical protein